MKPCPFCAEEIQDAAIKCRFCGSMIAEAPAPASPAPPTRATAPREPAPIEVLFTGGPSWRGQLGAHLLAGLLVAAGVALGAVLVTAFQQETPIALGAGALLALLGLGWLIALWVQRFVRYRITTRAIDVEKGILAKRIGTVQLWKVRDLEYEQSLLDRMLGLARMRVYTQDVTSPTFVIWGLPGSRAIFERLKDAIELARQSRNVIGVVE